MVPNFYKIRISSRGADFSFAHRPDGHHFVIQKNQMTVQSVQKLYH
ncbi:hypothetical protein [Rubritalea tangerina]